MRFFLRKNGEKIRFFIAFPAIFRDFCKIEKNSQVQNFWRILKGAPCKYTGRSWADHGQIMGRSWADHGQIMGRSWADRGRWLIFKEEVSDYREKKLTIELTIVSYFH